MSEGGPPTEPKVALELRDVRSGYGDLQVLNGVSLRLHEGAVEALLGRNGVGKTTLLSTITGLVPLWSGDIRFGDRSISRLAAHSRVGLGLVLVQEGKRVFHRLTVMENIMIGCFRNKLARTERRMHCKSIVEKFPLLHGNEDRQAGSLSGGQQQMLAIAQALAAEPRILLLDEPSAGLAPSIVDEVFEYVAQLRDSGLTIMLVEQLADRALDIADHVTVMDSGRVIRSGLPEEFADIGELEEAYFGQRAKLPTEPASPPISGAA